MTPPPSNEIVQELLDRQDQLGGANHVKARVIPHQYVPRRGSAFEPGTALVRRTPIVIPAVQRSAHTSASTRVSFFHANCTDAID